MNDGVKTKVSVLVLCYNQRASIERALDSVLGQHTDFDVEVIAGDDCSTDGTAETVRRYAERYPERVRVITGRENVGLVENYRRCLKAARGEYIADCAGDDFWTDADRLQTLTGMLESDRTVSAVFSDYEIMENGTSRTAPAYGADPESDRIAGAEVTAGALNHVKSLPFFLSAGIYRRSAVGNPDELFGRGWLCEDVAVEAAIGKSGDVLIYHKPTVSYTIGEETVSNSRDAARMARFYLADLKMTAELAPKYGMGQEWLGEYFDAKISYAVTLAWRSGGKVGTSEIEEAMAAWSLRPGIRSRIRMTILKIRELCRNFNLKRN